MGTEQGKITEEDLALYRGDYEEDGYIDFGGRGEHILLTLQCDDGSIDVLYDAPSIGFTNNYNSYNEALYDWYVRQYNLDRTEYPLYVLDWRDVLPDNYPAKTYPVHRYDGDGWYIYIPVSGWEPGVGSRSGTQATARNRPSWSRRSILLFLTRRTILSARAGRA